MMQRLAFGGLILKTKRKCTGLLGENCVFRRSLGVWCSGILFQSGYAWRLLSNLDSLCAQVLKEKYYPDGGLLKAGPKKGSSYTWHSIVAGLQTFQHGK
jgi:hypothetical protein